MNKINKKYLETSILKKLVDEKDSIISQWDKDNNLTTKYFIVDNFLDPDYFQLISSSLPSRIDDFVKLKTFRESKFTLSNLKIINKNINHLQSIFQDYKFIKFLSNLLSIDSLCTDKSNYAGGLSIMRKNDFLNPHIDNSHSKDGKMYRRLNLLFYLSNDTLNNGGDLELWDKNVCINKIIKTIPNRLVVMETNQHSWHSVSKIKGNQSRTCLSCYFYSEKLNNNFSYNHVTSFTGRPDEKFLRLISYIDNPLRSIVRKFIKR